MQRSCDSQKLIFASFTCFREHDEFTFDSKHECSQVRRSHDVVHVCFLNIKNNGTCKQLSKSTQFRSLFSLPFRSSLTAEKRSGETKRIWKSVLSSFLSLSLCLSLSLSLLDTLHYPCEDNSFFLFSSILNHLIALLLRFTGSLSIALPKKLSLIKIIDSLTPLKTISQKKEQNSPELTSRGSNSSG